MMADAAVTWLHAHMAYA